MSIFPYQQVRIQYSFLKVLNPGKSMQAYLHIIAHTIYIHLYRSRLLMNKITFQVCYHGCECKKSRSQ